VATRRKQPLKGPISDALNALARALASLPVPGMLIGGMAVIMRGVARVTRDVDATVVGGKVSTRELVEHLAKYDVLARIDDAIEFANTRQVLLLRHEPSGVDIDISVAWLPFELEAIRASETIPIAGTSMQVARAEDLVIYKAVAFRPQDQQDIERLITLHSKHMDLNRVRATVAEFAEAVEEPERVAELERIIERALA
jgi:predicted nucleotidyltransferase